MPLVLWGWTSNELVHMTVMIKSRAEGRPITFFPCFFNRWTEIQGTQEAHFQFRRWAANSRAASVLTPSCVCSDTRSGHGAWNVQTASSLTHREWCRHPSGPVNAAVLRAWRLGPGAPRTVVTPTRTGQACSTETPSTRWETLRIATGVELLVVVVCGYLWLQ